MNRLAVGTAAVIVSVCSVVVVANHTGSTSPRLSVTPARVRIDQPLAIRLMGLSAGQSVVQYCRCPDASGLDRQPQASLCRKV
jgi:hypothetical protein